MTANVEFHYGSRGELGKKMARRDYRIPDAVEIDVYNSTAEAYVDDYELGYDAADTLLSLIPESTKDEWNVCCFFTSSLPRDEKHNCLRRTSLQKGVWKNLKYSGWPNYLDDADLGVELLTGIVVDPLVARGVNTVFPEGEEGYTHCMALAKLPLAKLSILLAQSSAVKWGGVFLSRRSNTESPYSLQQLYLNSRSNRFEGLAFYLIEEGDIYIQKEFHPGIRPYEEFCIMAKIGILNAPVYIFPPSDRSRFD